MTSVRRFAHSMLLAVAVTAAGVGALIGPRPTLAQAAPLVIAPEAQAAFEALRTKHTYDYVVFKLDAAGKLVVDRTVARTSPFDYAAFRQAIIAVKEPRFVVLEYRLAIEGENRMVEKVVFIYWAPDKASVQLKMKYASATESVKKAFTGIAKSLQANTAADLDEANLKALVTK
jgi:Cofilin/tropomyosin-type actin-binding protein